VNGAAQPEYVGVMTGPSGLRLFATLGGTTQFTTLGTSLGAAWHRVGVIVDTTGVTASVTFDGSQSVAIPLTSAGLTFASSQAPSIRVGVECNTASATPSDTIFFLDDVTLDRN
jgi:hypothetical protein